MKIELSWNGAYYPDPRSSASSFQNPSTKKSSTNLWEDLSKKCRIMQAIASKGYQILLVRRSCLLNPHFLPRGGDLVPFSVGKWSGLHSPELSPFCCPISIGMMGHLLPQFQVFPDTQATPVCYCVFACRSKEIKRGFSDVSAGCFLHSA